MKCFSTLEEKFRVFGGHVISSICSSSKTKTTLEVISRYHENSPVSFREIAETSRKVTDLRAQSCPESKLVHNFIVIFHIPNYLRSQ